MKSRHFLKTYLHILIVAAVVSPVDSSGVAIDSPQVLAANLDSDQQAKRTEAFQSLKKYRTAVIFEAIKILEKSKHDSVVSQNSSPHLAALVLGEWKATEAIALLLDMIDLRTELQSGAKYPLGYEFPCAYALANIGGSDVINAAIVRIGTERSFAKRRLYTWIVYRLADINMGVNYLKVATKATSANSDLVKYLETAREDILKGNQLLLNISEKDDH